MVTKEKVPAFILFYFFFLKKKKKKKKKRKELGNTNEINTLIEKYKTLESKLMDNRRPRNNIVKL